MLIPQITAKVVNVDSPTGNKKDYIYSDTGFFRELQIFLDDILVYSSGTHHPQGPITCSYNRYQFYVPASSKEVFVNLSTIHLMLNK